MKRNLRNFLMAAMAAMLGTSAWAQTDVTSKYLTNAGFDDATSWQTGNVAAGGSANSIDVAGWTNGGGAAWSSSAAMGYVNGNQINGAAVPEKGSDGTADGGCLGLSVGWGGASMYTQSITLPAGTYNVSYAAYNAGSATQATNLIGFTDGTNNYYGKTTSFTSGKWVTETITFELTEETTGTISVGIQAISGGSGSNAKLLVDYIKLTSGIDLTSWNEAKAAAQTALDSYAASYAATERQAVVEAMSVADPQTATALNSAISTLNDAVAAYTPKAANEKLVAEKKSLTDFINGISTTYPNSSTELFPADLTKWTNSSYVGNNGGEHWSGVKTNYYEQSGAQWGQDSWSISAEKTVNLPVGKYAFVVTARASTGVTSTMTVDGKEVTLSNVGSVGYGITTDGTASYDMTGTYANTTGRGWEYAYAEFEVTEAKDVTISFAASAESKYNWVSVANPVLYYDNAAKDAMDLIEACQEILSLVDDVEVPSDEEIGDGVFQYNESNVKEFKDAKEEYASKTATEWAALFKKEGKTVDDVKTVKTAVESAIATMQTLNAPSATQAYKIVLQYSGWTYDNCAMTSEANARTNMGNYNVQYVAQNKNYAQAMYFTPVDGKTNCYNISWTDADGNTRYLCTGTPYSGNNYQIRTTTSKDDAMTIKVSRNGDYIQLYNVAAGAYIGSQDAGVYTVNSHNDFALIETSAFNEVEVSVANAGANCSTMVLPFNYTLPANYANKAYTVDGLDTDGKTLILTQVTALEANKAYLFEGTVDDIYYGVSVAYKAPEANGLLTGVYEDTDAKAGSYVLQSHDGNVAFYKVADSYEEGEAPVVAANRAFLTLPDAGDAAKVLNFPTADATAIDAVNALTSGNAKIYDVNGRQLKQLKKGINIVNGAKVLVK